MVIIRLTALQIIKNIVSEVESINNYYSIKTKKLLINILIKKIFLSIKLILQNKKMLETLIKNSIFTLLSSLYSDQKNYILRKIVKKIKSIIVPKQK